MFIVKIALLFALPLLSLPPYLLPYHILTSSIPVSLPVSILLTALGVLRMLPVMQRLGDACGLINSFFYQAINCSERLVVMQRCPAAVRKSLTRCVEVQAGQLSLADR